MRVLVTGGTGLVGSRLVGRLLGRGDQVSVLTRRPDAARKVLPAACAVVEGDPMQEGTWLDAVGDQDAVVNLAGENVFARRWSEAFKALLRESRIKSTRHVAGALLRNPRRQDGSPKVLVNASAIGYYGPRGDEELTEDSPPGDDFLAALCIDWEKEARAVEAAGVRWVAVRVGVVLDKKGGALGKLLTPFKLGGGGPVGSGKQWMSWVHHDDLVGLFLLALDNPGARGPLNGTAPNPVTNRDFARALGRALHRPSFVKTPGFALRLLVGGAAEVVLTGQRVLPRKGQQLGYAFKYPEVNAALVEIVHS